MSASPGPFAATGARAELRALTGARGIAAWTVVIFHIRASIAGLPASWIEVPAKGYLAVDFFFLLSGFVIWLSWGDRLRHGSAATVALFLQRRIARIWPLHLFILAIAVALGLMLVATGRPSPAPFAELPLHIFLLQNWGFTDELTWNVPAWSISCELAAYLLFPLFVRLVDWRSMRSWAVVVLIAALLAVLAAATRGHSSLGYDISHLGLARCLLEFAAGSGVCALWERWRASPDRPALASGAVAILLFAVWLGGVPETIVIPACFAAGLLALALTSDRRGNPLAWGPIHYLGEISYATYLSHFVLFFAFKLAFVRDAGAIPPFHIALYLVMVLASSAVLYRRIELPAQRWVNGLRLPGRRHASSLNLR